MYELSAFRPVFQFHKGTIKTGKAPGFLLHRSISIP